MTKKTTKKEGISTTKAKAKQPLKSENNRTIANKKSGKASDQEVNKVKEEKSPKAWQGRTVSFILKVGFVLKVIFYAIGVTLITIVLLGVVFGFGTYQYYANTFTTAKARSNSTQNVFLDKDGSVIYESFGAKSPDKVKISEVPDMVKKATLAAEDASFYNHGAIDPRGIIRAAVSNIKGSEKTGAAKLTDLFSEKNYTQGGSTITQQLVKNIYLTTERSFDRKIREIVYSFELEKRESKDQVFEDYLNNVYYGEQSLGISNAAKRYFGKNIKDLDLAEASMLAGLPASPTRLSPISGSLDEAKQRQQYVLSEMVHQKMIDYNEAKAAANETLYFSDKGSSLVLKHPYFVDYVKQELSTKFGSDFVDRGGLTVYTSLDEKNQNIAETKAKEYMQKFAYRKVTNTAIVVLDNKKGTISAMVGGVDYDKSNVNVATSKRQPGSSFKPIVYTAGLLSGFTQATRLLDISVNFGGIQPYIPHNYDGGYRGNITAHYALSNSLNIPAVEMAKLAGVAKVIDTAKKLGITSITGDEKQYGLSIGLGSAEVSPFEMARAYSIFANGGEMANFSGIEKVVDGSSNTIFQHHIVKEKNIDPKVAFIMANNLSDNQARSMVFGSVNPLTLKDRKVAAKTGTTDDYADSWTMGFTPNYTTGVWMGNNDHSKMARVSGIEGAAYIWHDVMEGIHQGIAAEDFAKPAGLSEVWVNAFTGLPASYHGSPNYLEYFLPGTEPTANPNLDYLKVFKK